MTQRCAVTLLYYINVFNLIISQSQQRDIDSSTGTQFICKIHIFMQKFHSIFQIICHTTS